MYIFNGRCETYCTRTPYPPNAMPPPMNARVRVPMLVCECEPVFSGLPRVTSGSEKVKGC
eukprot:4503545-Prymnesium_polylepis.1